MNKADILDKVKAILVANIGGRKFCFDIQDIYTTIVSDQVAIKYFPNNSCTIEFNGATIPLVELGSLFNLIEDKCGIDSRIIIIEINNKKLGFFVDNIVEIINIDGRNKFKLELIEDNDFYSFSHGILIYEDEYIFPNFFKIIEIIFTHYQN